MKELNVYALMRLRDINESANKEYLLIHESPPVG